MKKRLTAILTTVCLVLTVFSQTVLPASADNAKQPAGAPEFTHTFSDFGIEGTYAGNKSQEFNGDISKLLDGGTLGEIIKVGNPGAGQTFFYLFGKSSGSWEGLQFKMPVAYDRITVDCAAILCDSTTRPYMEIKASDFGLDHFAAAEFDFAAHFEKGDFNGDGSIDLQVKFYINGQQCMNTSEQWPAFQNGVFTIPGGYEKIVNAAGSENKFFSVYPTSGVTMTFRKPFKVTHTYRDFGIADGSHNANSNANVFIGDISDMLDGGMLYEQFNFSSVSGSGYKIIMFSNSSGSWEGLQITVLKDTLRIQNGGSILYDESLTHYVDIAASEAGLTSFVGTPFEFGMAFEKKDTDGNGSNDLLIRFYINGRRMSKTNSGWTAYQKGVFTLGGAYDKIVGGTNGAYQMINIAPQSSYVTMSGDYTTNNYLDYNAFSYLDFGVTNGIYNANDSGHTFLGNIEDLLDGGYLKETVRLNSLGSGAFFTVLFEKTAGSWAGLQMQYTTAGKLQFGVANDTLYDTKKEFYMHISPSDVGLTSFAGNEFEIMLAFDKADVDGNGSNDLLIKIYINGYRVYKTDAAWTAFQNGVYTIPGGYDKILNAASGTNQFLSFYPQGGNATFKATCDDTLAKDNYTAYTLTDAGISDGYSWAYGTLKDNNGNKITANVYDGTVFGAMLTFTKSGARFHYAVPEKSKYAGLQIRLDGDNLKVESYSNQLTYKPIFIYASQFGYQTFLNRAFKLQITTDFVDINKNGTDDVKFGIWIDGVLANNCYVYALDQVSLLGSDISINEGDGAVHYSLTDSDAPTGTMIYYVELEDGKPYLVDADLFEDAKGSSYENGQTVSVPGDYIAYYDANDNVPASQKQVVLWKPFDGNSDGNINILDVVFVKKQLAGIGTATASESRALDINSNGSVDIDDLVLLIKKLLGVTVSDSNAVYFKTESDGKVMPIGSWVTPDSLNGVGIDSGNFSKLTYYTDYGVETNFLQDKYFDMINDLGINVLTFQQADYSVYAKQRVLKALSLAEKYNLNAYVKDSGIADDIADSSLLASKLNEYARYSSFAGIHVTDEPSNATLNPGKNKTLTEIAPKTSLLNSFSGLEGFVNLYPVCRNRFTDYFSEYVSKCLPKQLSYDYYPFSSNNGTVNEYFNSLNYINKAAKDYSLPFVGFVGTSTCGYSTEPNNEVNNITPAQLSWNVNTLLAYGAKGINWFTLIEPYTFALKGSDGTVTGMDFNRAGVIGADGNKTQVYDAVKNINSWISEIDGILMDCNNVAVLADGITGDSNRDDWTNTYGGITLSAATSSGYNKGALAGIFDYNGKTVCYVVNNDYQNAQSVTVNFDSSSDITLYRQGQSATQKTNATSEILSLSAGEAVLIVKE